MTRTGEHRREASSGAHGQVWEGVIHAVYLVMIVLLASRHVDYLLARYDPALEMRIPFGILLLLLGNLAGLYACVVAMVVLLVLEWNSASGKGRASRIIVTVCMAIGVPLACWVAPRGVDRFAQGFEEWVWEKADLQAIGEWQVDEQEGIPSGAWPDCVKELRPVRVSSLGPGRGVKLGWGGGFIGHYGLVAGPTTMPIDPPGAYVRLRLIQPGAYVYFPEDPLPGGRR